MGIKKTVIDAELVDCGFVGEVFDCGCIATAGDYLPCPDCKAAAAAPDAGFIDAEFTILSPAPTPTGVDISGLIRDFVAGLTATKWGTI